MTPKEIYAAAVPARMVDPRRKGKTLGATLAAMFYTDIKKNGSNATFKLVTKGHFACKQEAS